MNSLDAAKSILNIAQELWGTSYVMDGSGAVWPLSGNGPNFLSLSGTVKAMRDHISQKHADELLGLVEEINEGHPIHL